VSGFCREEFARVDAETGEAIDWLSARLGPYPFETMGFVTVPIPGASLETQTLILMSTGAIGMRTAVHELAHMWLGNWVSLDSWGPMWLKEGLATYLQLLWEYREDPEGLALEMAALETAVAENGDTFPLNEPPPAKLFGFHVYIQGALLAHALRLEVGDAAFFAGLQAYVVAYGGGTAGPAEFQTALETAAGRSLDEFFRTWLAGN
jgi:aminopeptidase N